MGESLKEVFMKKVSSGELRICVLGLGHVGLPLSALLSEKYHVIGYDINKKRVEDLRAGKSTSPDVTRRDLAKKNLYFTNKEEEIGNCDAYFICVPTPLKEDKEPDLSFVIEATKTVSKFLEKGNLVVLESTTFPGTTEEIVKPLLEESSGLTAGNDFWLAYSPERIDPGNKEYPLREIPKIVGGINRESAEITKAVLSRVFRKIVLVRDTKTAEATKLFENIFRGVNIALVNEMALIFERMGIDTWEVIRAASTKPFAFMPHYPGPGVGGHCIPLDPYYLSYKAKRFEYVPKFIELSGEINEFMKIHTVNLVRKSLKSLGLNEIKGSRVLVLGLSYKKGVKDTRESPSRKVIEELSREGAIIRVYDPIVEEITTERGTFYSEQSLEDAVHWAQCIVLMTDHEEFKSILKMDLRNKAIVDCRNLFGEEIPRGCVYFCIGKPHPHPP
ncbi:UDP-N-acetyl-D-glucosamine dehydrogenase [Thermococci archaeon]|nr:MAG: UDP-N-acetyl-D-glucosamine dehydrogenase [Thermococci archaeon]